MLIRFCASNYLRSDGLVNGANGTFEDYINNVPILLLWIIYFNV
jgi:hypothetical protein